MYLHLAIRRCRNIRVFGVIYFVFCCGLTPAYGESESKELSQSPVKSVAVKSIADLSFYPRHRSSARVLAINNSELRAEISAKIAKIPVHVGDVVKAGTVIARLDCTDYKLLKKQQQAQLESLQAELSLAEYQLERANTLSSKKVLSEELLKQRETELLVSQAKIGAQEISVRQAQRNIDKCLVRAPYKAIVVKKLGQVGELVNPGMPIVQVTDAVKIEVSSMVQTHLIPQFHKVKQVTFVSRGREYPVTLRSITPAIETRERTQEVRFVFNNGKPLPGAAGEIYWTSTQAHIPAEYLIKRQDEIGLFIVENNIARFHRVDDAVAGRSAPVSMSGDTKIVTTGRYRLEDGDRVSSK